MNSRTKKWILVTVVASAIAAATTVLILALRARAKKKAWYDEEAAFDYDLDDEFVIADSPEVEAEPIEE